MIVDTLLIHFGASQLDSNNSTYNIRRLPRIRDLVLEDLHFRGYESGNLIRSGDAVQGSQAKFTALTTRKPGSVFQTQTKCAVFKVVRQHRHLASAGKTWFIQSICEYRPTGSPSNTTSRWICRRYIMACTTYHVHAWLNLVSYSDLPSGN